jgi:hypothetical protein
MPAAMRIAADKMEAIYLSGSDCLQCQHDDDVGMEGSPDIGTAIFHLVLEIVRPIKGARQIRLI